MNESLYREAFVDEFEEVVKFKKIKKKKDEKNISRWTVGDTKTVAQTSWGIKEDYLFYGIILLDTAADVHRCFTR